MASSSYSPVLNDDDSPKSTTTPIRAATVSEGMKPEQPGYLDTPMQVTSTQAVPHRPPHASNFAASSRWAQVRLGLKGPIGRICVTLAIVAATLLFTVVFGATFLFTNGRRPNPIVHSVGGQAPREEGMLLFGSIKGWDLENKKISVRFMPHWCRPRIPRCEMYLGTEDVFIFMGIDALGIGGFNESAAVLQYRLELSALPVDQFMELEVFEHARAGKFNLWGRESDAMYPFDWYKVKMVFAATAADLTTTRPVIAMDIYDFLETQWQYSVSYTYVDDYLDHATILASEIVIKRSIVTRLSAILIVMLNWAVTLAVLHMTLTYTIGRLQLPEGLDSVALPFSGLFALPSVRSVMPGNPPFGCLIDFIGIIPNLAIISVCATLLLVMRIKRETHQLVVVPEVERERLRKIV